MIFVTVGTEKYPFDRLLQYVHEAVQNLKIQENLFCQVGPSTYNFRSGTIEKFVPFSKMVTLIQEASLVITHGGVGTVNLCLSFGKRPLVCPREHSLGEAIDDHQIAYSQHMEKMGYLLMARTAQEIQSKMKETLSSQSTQAILKPSPDKMSLVAFLDSVLLG